METVLPTSITDARSNAAKLGATASQYAAKQYTIPDELKKVVQEALDYNKDVISGRSTALSEYMKAPADANVRFGVQNFSQGEQAGQANPNYIFNPFERNKAMSDFVSNQEIPFFMWNTLLGQREGTIADTVNAGTRAFQAGATDAAGKANSASQAYQDLLAEFKLTEDIKARNKELAIREMEANKSGAGNDPLTALLALMGPGAGGKASPKPTYSPKKNGEISKDGQWKYDAKVKDWVSTGTAPSGGGSSLLSDFMTPETVASMIAADPKNSAKYTAIYKMAADQKKTAGAGDSIKNITTTLDQYLTAFNKVPYLERANPLNPKGAELDSFKNILTNILAKEVENGRLTDADRQFYLDQMPAPWMPGDLAKAKVEGIKKGLMGKISGGGMSVQAPSIPSLSDIFGF